MKLPRRSFLHLAVGAVALPAFSRLARAQAYPSRPVRMIVGFGPGAAPDIVARLAGQWLSDRLGQPVLIENRPGAASNIATEAVVRAEPDGYTIQMTVLTNVFNTTLYTNLKFNFGSDIAHVAGVANAPYVVVVTPTVPAKTIPEFIAYAKANPGKISFGSQGFGVGPHLLLELLKLEAGIKMTHVPYRGTAPMLTALLAGEVQLVIDPTTTSLVHIQSGKIRPLAIAGPSRTKALPDVPTTAEAGYPKLSSPFWLGVVAPTGTPKDIIAKLNGAFREALGAPETRERLANFGAEAKIGTPDEFGKLIANELALWQGVVRDANITVE
jgi:tripartite-type tricarboxylate transporter receptor subunit TctC